MCRLTPSTAAPVPFLRAIPRGLHNPDSALISGSVRLPAGRVFSTRLKLEPQSTVFLPYLCQLSKSFPSLIILNQLIIFHTDCSVTRTQRETATFLVRPCPDHPRWSPGWQPFLADEKLGSNPCSFANPVRRARKTCHRETPQLLKRLQR